MRRDYAQMNSAAWVARNYSHPKGMSDIGKEVAQVLGVVGGGIYNCPIRVEKVNWHDWYISVYWAGDLASWDHAGLSILVIECARRMLRVSIEPGNMRGVRLVFRKRKGREGGVADKIPELRDIMTMVEGWYND